MYSIALINAAVPGQVVYVHTHTCATIFLFLVLIIAKTRVSSLKPTEFTADVDKNYFFLR